jgi:hypothetical protein
MGFIKDLALMIAKNNMDAITITRTIASVTLVWFFHVLKL